MEAQAPANSRRSLYLISDSSPVLAQPKDAMPRQVHVGEQLLQTVVTKFFAMGCGLPTVSASCHRDVWLSITGRSRKRNMLVTYHLRKLGRFTRRPVEKGNQAILAV